MMENLEFIGWIILAFVVGYWCGSKATALLHTAATRFLLDELKIKPQQLKAVHDGVAQRLADLDSDREVIDVRLEQHQGVIFAYRSDDGLFLGQGTNQEDLVKSIMGRLSNCTVRIQEDQGAELLQKNNTKIG